MLGSDQASSAQASVLDQVHAWYGRERVADPMERLDALQLSKHVEELNAYGFTVIPPEKAAPAGFWQELRDGILALAQQRSGVTPDTDGGGTHRDQPRGTGELMSYMLLGGEVFERALMNENVQALIEYLLGDGFVLSSMSTILKGPGNVPLDLHSDNGLFPAPFPAFSQVANASWLLSDYTKENGSLCMWPGSHKFCRQPTPEETASWSKFMPVEAPAGSLVVWHGNTWHGAFARRTAGLRINLIQYFCRPYMATQEWYRDKISAEAVARNSPVFARLVGLDAAYPFPLEGPDYERVHREIVRAARGA
jgi:ectoine hydroxylase-related dioxygenase (phytanoyl-CoA dioxygenase family)